MIPRNGLNGGHPPSASAVLNILNGEKNKGGNKLRSVAIRTRTYINFISFAETWRVATGKKGSLKNHLWLKKGSTMFNLGMWRYIESEMKIQLVDIFQKRNTFFTKENKGAASKRDWIVNSVGNQNFYSGGW